MERTKEYEKIRNRYRDGDIGRREFLSRVGKLAIASGVVGSGIGQLLSSANASDGRTVRFDGFGGASQPLFDKHVLQPFAEKLGVTVTQGSYTSSEQFLAQLMAEGIDKYNIFWSADEYLSIRIKDNGWAAEIEESKIPRLNSIRTDILDVSRAQGGGTIISVPYALSGGAIAYNTEFIDEKDVAEHGYRILLDASHRGHLSGVDSWRNRIYYAAFQTGQDPNNITDMDAVWEVVGESKRSVLKYYTSSAEQIALFTSREIYLADMWFVPINNLRLRGEPIDWWPKHGAYTQTGSLMALDGTPMDLFYEMVDILLDPEVLFPLGEETGFVPLLDSSQFEFPENVAKIPGYIPPGSDIKYNRLDPVYWAENQQEWIRQYQRVMSRA